MKKILFIICIIGIYTYAFGLTIHSTPAGGNWNQQSTWEEGIIPDLTYDVEINGPVIVGYVISYDIYGNECNDIVINAGGSLINRVYGAGMGIFSLTIWGDCSNDGSVTNGAEDALGVFIYGDLTNNGIWKPYQTHLMSTNNQNLSLATGHSFGSIITRDTDASLTALTDMDFTCGYSIGSVPYTGDFDLNGVTFHLGTHSIDATGTFVYNGTLEGDFEIKGTFTISKHIYQTMVFNGTVTVTDTLQANVYGSGYGIYDLKVEGDIINNGVIKNNDTDDLRIKVSGDIYNNGLWSNNYTELIGTNDQYLFQSSGKHFEGDFSDTDSTSNIIASSDLTFSNNFDLNDATLDMQSYTLTMQGWLMDGSIDNALLHGGYLQDITSLGGLTTDGIVTINENNNIFIGSTIVNGIIQSNEYGGGSTTYTVTIDSDITNNGTLRNYNIGDKLKTRISGNIINNGNWEHSYTDLHGSETQYITQNSRTQFHGDFVDLDSTSMIVAKSDLNFSGNIDLNQATFNMQSYTLTMQNWLEGGVLENATLNGGYLDDLTCLGPLTITGTVTIEDDYNVFQGDVVVNGILQSNSYGGGAAHYDLTVDGNITNNGTIKNINSGDRLLLYISGNIINNGTWENYQTYLNGDSDQYIKIIAREQITGEVRFDANHGSSDFQWYFNDNVVDSPDFSGETSQILTWNVPVPSSWLGTFYCQTNDGQSRNIIVYNSLLEPENVVIEIIGSNVMISWDAVASANSYKVYSSDDSYTGFMEDTSGIFIDESWSAPAPPVKKFYYVTAAN